jgi:leucyl aminopeptidase
MPLKKSYKANIKSKIADIKNTGAKGGGSITAALFLQVECKIMSLQSISLTDSHQ